MRGTPAFARYDGEPRDPEEAGVEVEDDGDPVLRAKSCKRCGPKPRTWSDPGFLVLGLLAFIVLGYLSAFYTTRQLQEDQQQIRQPQTQGQYEQIGGLQVAVTRDGEGTDMSERHARDIDKSSRLGLDFEGALGQGQQQSSGWDQDQRHELHDTQAKMEEGAAQEDAGTRFSRPWLGTGVSGIFENSGDGKTVDDGRPGGDSGGSRESKPNVFFFLVDDMGHADIGYQSSDLRELTPNLNALAAGGIKLSSYYSMSICTPARAALMTGRYPVRLGMQYSVIVPGQPWGLPLEEKILPEYMNDAGYESHMVGKWHLGSYNYASLPNNRGFDTFLGYLNGEDDYWTHQNFEAYLDGQPFYDFGFGNETDYFDITRINDKGRPCPSTSMLGGNQQSGHDYAGVFLQNPIDVCYTGGYPTDAFLGRAHQVVSSKTPWDEKPLFMYIAHQSVHSPVGPAPIEGFSGEERAKLETLAETTTSSTRAQFAGVLAYLDKRIGSFVHMLEAHGWLENSIIVLASDNGGCPADGGSNYPLRGSKQSMFEGGTKVPAFIYSKSHLPKESWGTTYDGLMHVSDWVPTLASAAGGQITGSAGPLDGIDHWESILTAHTKDSSKDSPRTELLYNWDDYLLSSSDTLTENAQRAQGAFRDGKWKLLMNVWCSGYYSFDPLVIATDALLNENVTCVGNEGCEDCADVCQDNEAYLFADRLYNLEEDFREENDVIHEYPEIATRLKARALQLVYEGYKPSAVLEVNTDSYNVWADNGWWMVPWVDKLSPEGQRSRK